MNTPSATHNYLQRLTDVAALTSSLFPDDENLDLTHSYIELEFLIVTDVALPIMILIGPLIC